MKNSLKNRFLEFVLKERLFEPGDKVLVGVSGGVDSMVLLHLLCTWQRRLKIEIGIIHLHHGIRGAEADTDREFVNNTASEMSLPCHVYHRRIPEFARKHKLSLEEAGHQVREALFRQEARKLGYSKIATGHHLDDQAETVLMRLLTGSGLQGLAGIRLKHRPWVRPLLFADRPQIEGYATSQRIRFRKDRTNLDKTILRNKIRNQLLPLLKNEYNPRISEHLFQLSGILAEWDRYLERSLDEVKRKGMVKPFKNKIRLEIPLFKAYFSWIKFRLLEHILRRISEQPVKLTYMKFRDFEYWSENSQTGTEFEWGGKIKCIRHQDSVIFYVEESKEIRKETFPVYPEQWYPLPNNSFRLKISSIPKENVVFHDDRSEEFIDGTGIEFPLYVRPWQRGDRFVPLGFSHERLVSDYLTDKKIGRPERNQVCVLLNGDKIVAVLNIQISELYRVRQDSQNVYSITILPKDNDREDFKNR